MQREVVLRVPRRVDGGERPAATEVDGLEVLVRWAEVAEAAWRAGDDVADALTANFALTGVAQEHLEKAEVLSGVHSNAAGLRRFFETSQHRGEGHE